jgi:ABC-type Mn2+/Zn2+ transport system permease subunit
MTLAEAWQLFAWSWLAAGAAAVGLALIGVATVARGQVLRVPAVAQATAAAAAVALLAGAHADALTNPWIGRLSTIAAAVVATVCLRRAGALADAWLLLAAGAASPLLLGQLPHGRAELDRVLFSSLLGADCTDALLTAGFAAATVTVAALCRRTLVAVLIDPVAARAHGLEVGRWDLGLAVWTGLGIGLVGGTAGALFTAAVLILPAMTARVMCRTTGAALVAAPVIALVAVALGEIIALTADLPPGQTMVAVLALLAALAAAGRRGS